MNPAAKVGALRRLPSGAGKRGCTDEEPPRQAGKSNNFETGLEAPVGPIFPVLRGATDGALNALCRRRETPIYDYGFGVSINLNPARAGR